MVPHVGAEVVDVIDPCALALAACDDRPEAGRRARGQAHPAGARARVAADQAVGILRVLETIDTAALGQREGVTEAVERLLNGDGQLLLVAVLPPLEARHNGR